MIRVIDEYKDKQSPAPNRDIDPARKSGRYSLEWAKYLYSLYVRGKCAWSQDHVTKFQEWRKYARGKQGNDKYKSFLLDDSSKMTGKSQTDVVNTPLGRMANREGWVNVLFENISIAPKVMDAFHGMFDDVEFDIFVDAIDSNSKDRQEHDKWLKYVQGVNQQWQAQYKKNAGIPVDEQVELPKSLEELEMMAANDGFKLNIAKAMEKLTRASLDGSHWEDVIKKKVLADAFEIGYLAAKDYYDNEEGRFKASYRDPARMMIQYSEEHDYSDYEYAGYYSAQTISWLKKKRPDITEIQWRDLARDYAGYEGNEQVSATEWDVASMLDPSEAGYPWDNFKVLVFEAEWMDTDTKRNLKIKSVYGRDTVRELDFDETVKPLSKKQIEKGAEQKEEKIFIRRYRQCSWVVGSEIIFDDGPINMLPRPNMTRPVGTYHVEQMPQGGIIERLIPFLDQLMITWLKYQNSVAMMIENGYAVNVGMLMNISDGKGKKWDMLQLLKMMRQTGVLPYMLSMTGNYTGGAPTPITPIGGGMGERVKETAETFAMIFTMIENITGLNPVALGTNPDPNAPVGTTQMALNATNNTLKPFITALFEIKRSLADSLMQRIQIGIRANEDIRKVYAGLIGDADVQMLRDAEKLGAQYGLLVRQRPSAEYKQRLSKYIEVALAASRDGGNSLELPDGMLIDEKMWRGENLTAIRQEVTYHIKKSKAEYEQKQQQLVAQQQQGLQQQEQMKAQAAQQMLQAEIQKEMALRGMDAGTVRMTNNSKFIEIIMSKENNGMERKQLQDALQMAVQSGGLDKVDLPLLYAMVGSMAATAPPPAPVGQF
jgi:hypothetical protein